MHLFCYLLIMVTSEAISWKISLTLITLAYVTYQDIRKISGLKDQTVIVVKAPPETRLEVPDPLEVRRRHVFVHLQRSSWNAEVKESLIHGSSSYPPKNLKVLSPSILLNPNFRSISPVHYDVLSVQKV